MSRSRGNPPEISRGLLPNLLNPTRKERAMKAELRKLVEHYRERETMRDEYLSQYRDANGDVSTALLTEYDEQRADNNEDAAEDLSNLLDALEKLS